jgi:recombination protein RecT
MSTAPARQQPVKDFPARLEGRRDEIARALPSGLAVDRFIMTARIAYSQEPKLTRCSQDSVLIAVMKAAELGLEIGKPLDMCHLVPYGQECNLIIDYKGMIELARRTGEYAAIDARLVHEADEFELYYDPAPVFRHRPHLGPDRGEITHAYGWCRLRTGADHIEVMTRDEIEAIRRGSSSGTSPAWRNHYGEMCRKTPLKRMFKRTPRSVELARAIEIDDARYDLSRMHVSGPPRTGPKSQRVLERLESRGLPAPEEPEFDAGQGVAQPLRSEADDDDLTPQHELDADAAQ